MEIYWQVFAENVFPQETPGAETLPPQVNRNLSKARKTRLLRESGADSVLRDAKWNRDNSNVIRFHQNAVRLRSARQPGQLPVGSKFQTPLAGLHRRAFRTKFVHRYIISKRARLYSYPDWFQAALMKDLSGHFPSIDRCIAGADKSEC